MHIFLKKPGWIACKKCGKEVLPHTLCENCGTYRNKEIVDVLAKLTKKERKQKEKELSAQGQAAAGEGQVSKDTQASPQRPTELNPQDLSKA